MHKKVQFVVDRTRNCILDLWLWLNRKHVCCFWGAPREGWLTTSLLIMRCSQTCYYSRWFCLNSRWTRRVRGSCGISKSTRRLLFRMIHSGVWRSRWFSRYVILKIKKVFRKVSWQWAGRNTHHGQGWKWKWSGSEAESSLVRQLLEEF